jgi:hypothetical protein
MPAMRAWRIHDEFAVNESPEIAVEVPNSRLRGSPQRERKASSIRIRAADAEVSLNFRLVMLFKD